MKIEYKIKEIRKKVGLTQIELAQKSGIGLSTIKRYETGKNTPTKKSLIRLADALNVTVDDLESFDMTGVIKDRHIYEIKGCNAMLFIKGSVGQFEKALINVNKIKYVYKDKKRRAIILDEMNNYFYPDSSFEELEKILTQRE